MQHDPIRLKIKDLLWQRGLSMREASLAIGRNHSYLYRFVERSKPRALTARDTVKLAELLGCEARELRHTSVPPRKRWTRKPRPAPPVPAPAAVSVPEMEVEAAAGPGALNEEYADERARWQLPEAMIRHEGNADPAALRILRVRGNSMEPEMREGDRIVVDTARRVPAMGELFVLWDGDGLVVKRVEKARDPGPLRLRLVSANPDYPPYTCLAEEANIVGKVIWTVKRA